MSFLKSILTQTMTLLEIERALLIGLYDTDKLIIPILKLTPPPAYLSQLP